MFSGLEERLRKVWGELDFDSLAIGVIDFANHSYNALELTERKSVYYDLASVTKVLTLAATYLTEPDVFDEDSKLLINHRAGLPSWGILSKDNWREQIQSYPIKESPTLYSDFSSLRAMLEIEKRLPVSLHEHCKTFWDKEVCFWKDLPAGAICPDTGFRHGKVINGEVHDPNAYNISKFCSHAGLFATVDGVCRTLLGLQKSSSMLEIVARQMDVGNRAGEYVLGWNRRSDPEKTLAGKGAGEKTFGHLGFTGTSIWIDPDMKRGVVVLSNSTQNYWYERAGIDSIRRMVGTFVFLEL